MAESIPSKMLTEANRLFIILVTVCCVLLLVRPSGTNYDRIVRDIDWLADLVDVFHPSYSSSALSAGGEKDHRAPHATIDSNGSHIESIVESWNTAISTIRSALVDISDLPGQSVRFCAV